jgi:hypothetical protein
MFYGAIALALLYCLIATAISISIDKIQQAAFECNQDMGRYLVF